MRSASVFLQQPFLVVPSSIEPVLSHQRVSQRVALSLAYARYIRHLLTSPLRPSKLEPWKEISRAVKDPSHLRRGSVRFPHLFDGFGLNLTGHPGG